MPVLFVGLGKVAAAHIVRFSVCVLLDERKERSKRSHQLQECTTMLATTIITFDRTRRNNVKYRSKRYLAL
jgi:hypothetical protein